MLEGISLGTEFLNRCVPMWFALVMGFTAPYMWSNYAKKGSERLFKRWVGSDESTESGN